MIATPVATPQTIKPQDPPERQEPHPLPDRSRKKSVAERNLGEVILKARVEGLHNSLKSADSSESKSGSGMLLHQNPAIRRTEKPLHP